MVIIRLQCPQAVYRYGSDVARSEVSVSVCLSVRHMGSCAKTAEPIEMLLGG